MKKNKFFIIIFFIICLLLHGCKNKNSIAKDSYSYLNNASSCILSLVIDHETMFNYINSNNNINVNLLSNELIIKKDEILDAFISVSENYLNDQDIIDDIKKDPEYYFEILSPTNKDEYYYSYYMCRSILNKAYENIESFKEININLESAQKSIKKLSPDHEMYQYLKDYYLCLTSLYDLTKDLEVSYEEFLKISMSNMLEIKELKEELDFYFTE